MNEDILLNQRDARGVVTLTLNRPQAFNALSEAMLTALQVALDALAIDDGLRAVVRYDPTKVTPDRIVSAIEDLGYKARLVETQSGDRR